MTRDIMQPTNWPTRNPAVSEVEQDRTLRMVLAAVETAAINGQKPVVEIDLDLTALMPISRTRKALISASRFADVPAFSTPQLLPFLPGYSDEAWRAFIRQTSMLERFPEIDWGTNIKWSKDAAPYGKHPVTVYTKFHEAYWTDSWMIDDTPTPGLAEFVEKIRCLGGEAAFISGRWRPEQVGPSYHCLEKSGITKPVVVIGNSRHPSLNTATNAMSDADVKIQHQHEIESRYGNPVAIIDDRQSNRTALIEAKKQPMLSVAVCIPGFTYDPVSDRAPLRISTFNQIK